MSNTPDEFASSGAGETPGQGPGQIPPGPGLGGQPPNGTPAAGSGAPGQSPYAAPQYGAPQYGQAPYGQAPQYGAHQYGQAQYGHQPYGLGGYAGPDPAALKRMTTARTNGILSIVFGGVAFFILGFLSIPGLVLGIQALTAAPKIQAAGLPAGPVRTLAIIGVVVSAISLAGWLFITVARVSSL